MPSLSFSVLIYFQWCVDMYKCRVLYWCMSFRCPFGFGPFPYVCSDRLPLVVPLLVFGRLSGFVWCDGCLTDAVADCRMYAVLAPIVLLVVLYMLLLIYVDCPLYVVDLWCWLSYMLLLIYDVIVLHLLLLVYDVDWPIYAVSGFPLLFLEHRSCYRLSHAVLGIPIVVLICPMLALSTDRGVDRRICCPQADRVMNCPMLLLIFQYMRLLNRCCWLTDVFCWTDRGVNWCCWIEVPRLGVEQASCTSGASRRTSTCSRGTSLLPTTISFAGRRSWSRTPASAGCLHGELH